MKKTSGLRIDPQLSISLSLFAVLGVVIAFFNKAVGTEWGSFVLVLNNTFMNIFVFGIVLVWLDKKQRRRRLTKTYLEQLEDFRFWRSEEGVWRKVGIMRRLKEFEEPLPSLKGMELEHAILEDFDLRGQILDHANLCKAFLWKAKLTRTSLERAVLERTYLEQAHMEGANLTKVYAGMADFREANISQAKLVCANLELALFIQTEARQSDFEGANLAGAQFDGADLSGSLFHRANLMGADFNGAIIADCDFRGAELSGAKNLTIDQLKGALIDESTHLPDTMTTYRDTLLESLAKRDLAPVASNFQGQVPAYRAKPDMEDFARCRGRLDMY